MSKRDDAVYLGHMRDLATTVVELVNGVTREGLESDRKLQLALAHAVQIVGEAARHVSTATAEAHPEVPWARIIGMRHKLVHDYFETDLDVVWQAATIRIPELLELLEKITPPVPPSA
jgi:uncharacterized protein with HEPN domain